MFDCGLVGFGISGGCERYGIGCGIRFRRQRSLRKLPIRTVHVVNSFVGGALFQKFFPVKADKIRGVVFDVLVISIRHSVTGECAWFKGCMNCCRWRVG